MDVMIYIYIKYKDIYVLPDLFKEDTLKVLIVVSYMVI